VAFNRFFASAIGVALVLWCGVAEAAGAPSPDIPAAAVRPSLEIRTRSAVGPASFAITDDGMPAAGTYSSSAPVGFNNTGQIYGIGARKAKADPTVGHIDQSCLLWTGSKYVDLAPSLIVTACTPYSINSADAASGSYTVVGSFIDVHHYTTDAFAAHLDASGISKLVPYYDHYPAALYGVNGSGTAVGYSSIASDYKLFPGPMFVTAPPELMNILQAGCFKLKQFCLEPLQLLNPKHRLYGEPSLQCAFGGCTINDGGTVFGSYDQPYQYIGLYTPSAPVPFQALPYNFDPQNGVNFFVSLNNANQLLYFQQQYINGATPVFAKIFNVATNVVTLIPPVAGTSCRHYFPISMNNAGAVLGFTSYCTRKAFYWTWDPVHGTQNLGAAIPVNAYSIKPLAINDNGQILVSLQTAAGVTHWGTLDPLTSGTSARRGSEGS
jgi:hypothetical protein